MIVALVAGFLGLFYAVKTIQSNKSAVIKKRGSVKAWLLMPKELRVFNVEKYIRPGDGFIYTAPAGPGSLIRGRLQINTASEHRKHWENAFDNYAKERKFVTYRIYQRSGNKLYKGYRISNGDRCWLIFEDIDSTGDLQITLLYQVNPGNRKIRNYMAFVAFQVRKLWNFLRGNGSTFDSITRAS